MLILRQNSTPKIESSLTYSDHGFSESEMTINLTIDEMAYENYNKTHKSRNVTKYEMKIGILYINLLTNDIYKHFLTYSGTCLVIFKSISYCK